MSEPLQPKRSLSEISHLFLSSVRDKQTNGAPRPVRVPPRKIQEAGGSSSAGKQDLSIDLTPEEFAEVFGSGGPATSSRQGVRITAVLGAHLNGHQFDRVKEYARHIAGSEGRVGLIELDASEFRVMCFEARNSNSSQLEEPQAIEVEDGQQIAEALQEMSFDVHRWLLLVPSLRTPEAKALLRAVDHWVLLSTCDHDGIVSSYRLLKGLAEANRPRLSLALLDAADEAEIDRVYKKLSGVCQQFLNWPLESEPAVRAASRVGEQLVLCSRPIREKSQIASAPQWSVVADFLASAKAALPDETAAPETVVRDRALEQAAQEEPVIPPVEELMKTNNETQTVTTPATPIASPVPMRLVEGSGPASDPVIEVLDLHGDDVASILAAVLKQNGEFVECPIRPPMCVEARLAVARDRSIVLLAVAHQGLTELRAIGQAYRWIVENRSLLAMALPQFALDAERQPRLRLLVDQADSRADVLQPMLGSEHVTVQAYRRLRWGTKMGLFLEAA